MKQKRALKRKTEQYGSLRRLVPLCLTLLPCFPALVGCGDPEAIRLASCTQQVPDKRLIREPTLARFIDDCGLAHYTDVTGKVALHYDPPRGDGTLPVIAASPFAISEAGGTLGRVWYFCMPVPVPVASVQPDASPTVAKTVQAVCRYAGSGTDQSRLTYDEHDATAFDPRKW